MGIPTELVAEQLQQTNLVEPRLEILQAAFPEAEGGAEEPIPRKKPVRKWFRKWVPQDTILSSGTCMLLKWVNEDILNSTKNKVIEEEKEPEDEFEVVYLCTFEGCGKVFIDFSTLRKHAHVHGEKQCICHYEGCGRRFVDSSKLKRHFLTHTGEKHFVCPFEGCGKAFSLDFNLRSHMRIHTGENYHSCPFEDCGKRYAHEYKLRAHLKTHHEKIVPDVKPAPVQPEPDLPKIVSVPPAPASLERPFVCPFVKCNKRYLHEYKLNLHLRKGHSCGENAGETLWNGKQSDGEDNMDKESDQDITPQAVNVSRGFGKGKLRIISKTAKKTTSKRKRGSPTPRNLSKKLQAAAQSGRSIIAKSDSRGDSEETEDDGGEDTEEDVGRQASQIYEYDDEETEDDMD
ncbi:hypothetical protein O6H91_03G025300 [Diphasiastrum complanatum]|uniref:Uncharacterized protein n=1 Tax=Diphasiastrum complanatum TaxID=34168 RepID=A0ACC2E495_DIPCM|nr:hypothetical protein O6H91_03G025300 [Diphasiastrum complanatum]